MPISGDVNLDRDDPDYGLPLDTCCVGGGGPSPQEAAVISTGSGPSAGLPARLSLAGGPPPSYRAFGSATGKPKSFANVPTTYEGPVGTGKERT